MFNASTPWPYPRWIAHRGAGTLAPENTLAAFWLGARYGYRMFECDAKLCADGVLFLLHDDTLERTTNGQGRATALPMTVLAQLDAGSWHSGAFAGEPIPTLEALARECLVQGWMLNVEIKPDTDAGSGASSSAWATGYAVGHLLAPLWAQVQQATPVLPLPLLTSFVPQALEGARAAAAHLPRGLLVESAEEEGESESWQSHTLATAQRLACQALVLHYPLCRAAFVRRITEAGLRTLAYTVNDHDTAQRLLALGINGIITDRLDRFQARPGIR